jgi:hypothetical protein
MKQLNLLEVEEFDTDCEIKTCTKCYRLLPLHNFGNASGGNYLRKECKSCANKLRKVRDRLRSEVEPPPEDYTCPICDRGEEEVRGEGGKKSGPWVLDHDHTTDKFRGWLCHSCNRNLGSFNEDLSRMKKAMKYLSEI